MQHNQNVQQNKYERYEYYNQEKNIDNTNITFNETSESNEYLNNKNKLNFVKKNNLFNDTLNNNKLSVNLRKYDTIINNSPDKLLEYQDNSLEYNNISLYDTLNFNNLEKIQNLNQYNSLILILDYKTENNSTNIFLKSLLIKFKQYQNYMIVRNTGVNNTYKYTITLNDEYLIVDNLNGDECINFLKNNNDKINKIFINHIYGFSYDYLNKIISLNKEIGTITHDYSLIIKNNETYFNDFYDITQYIDKNIFDINKFDFIITPNIKNLNIYKHHINPDKKVILTELPDFKTNDIRINTNNNKIIIGIIGNINNNNDKNILKNLFEYYKYDINIEFIIFGSCNVTNIICASYNTINEFNDLLIKYKPNLLIELSSIPETYSYPLTLSMLTGLPILSLRKNQDCVIENRLSSYDKVYYFNTLEEFNDLIFKYKQNYFYTIKPFLYYSSFWEEFFVDRRKIIYKTFDDKKIKNIDMEKINNIVNKNIIIVTSNIKLSANDKLTNNEILKQTLETINSIKKYIPDYYIILFDNSIFNTDEYNILDKSVDKFINITDDFKLNHNINICDLNTVVELSQYIKIYNIFLKYIDFTKNKNVFKISAGIVINADFKYENYDNDKNIFKKYEYNIKNNNNNIDSDTDIDTDTETVKNKKNNYFTKIEKYYTCFYKLYNNIVPYFYNELKRLLDTRTYDELTIDVDTLLPEIVKIKIIHTLGLTYYDMNDENINQKNI